MMAMDERATLIHGDCLAILPELPRDAAIVSDPPYGMNWNTDTRRFVGGGQQTHKKVYLTADVCSDDEPFDPSPWLVFRKIILWGANHYAVRLPIGSTLVWVKKADHHFGSFLSDAEIGWQKGGHGVYCFRKNFAPPSRIQEGGLRGRVAHPTQKPLALMRWCIERLKLKPGSLIVDPYMGSGTTGVAALRLGHRFLGVECDEAHFATARRRIDAALAETPLFVA